MNLIKPPSGNPVEEAMKMIMHAAQRNNLRVVAQGVVSVIDILDKGLRRLWEIIMENNRGITQNAMMAEVMRLTTQMMSRILVEKGILTEEELEKKYKDEVEAVIEEMQKEAEEEAEKAKQEIQEKIKEAEEKQKEAAEKIEKVTETLKEAAEDSDVVLASEKGNVIKFPDKDKEEEKEEK